MAEPQDGYLDKAFEGPEPPRRVRVQYGARPADRGPWDTPSEDLGALTARLDHLEARVAALEDAADA